MSDLKDIATVALIGFVAFSLYKVLGIGKDIVEEVGEKVYQAGATVGTAIEPVVSPLVYPLMITPVVQQFVQQRISEGWILEGYFNSYITANERREQLKAEGWQQTLLSSNYGYIGQERYVLMKKVLLNEYGGYGASGTW